MRLLAYARRCRLLGIAALGAALALSAGVPTGAEAQTPSTAAPGSASQSPNAGTADAGTQSQSSSAATSSNAATSKSNSASAVTQPRKPAAPDILIVVSKPTQTMTVTVDGQVRYRWRVSTGATHYSTPSGSYTPFRMEVMHYSREWDNAGMPHAIFFTQRGHSIHGSDHPGLGTAVSHGCVRLTLANAATLYQLVKSVGMTKTKVVVSGKDPPGYRAPTMPPRQPVGPFGGFFRF
jgi:lipoprotein-anchoring transpeptidase ErfK/SrfK